MYLYYNTKKLSLLFAISLFLITIVTISAINSVLGLPSSSSLLPLAKKEKENSTVSFKITDQINVLLNNLVDKNKTNGAFAIGFVDPNGTQFYGHGELSNTSNATVDQNTIFAIGSNTKVFTTILLADMVNKGLVKLDDPIEKYLPSNVTVPQYNGHKITIEDLATHTSGLPDWPDNLCPEFDSGKTAIQFRINLMDCTKDYTFDQLYQGLSNTTLSGEPGPKFDYSNFGTALLGHILTLKSNMSSFDKLLAHNILDVLGMNDTSIGLSDSQKSRLAIGHLNGQELPTENNSNPMVPGGALYSTASDMTKFLSANMGLIKTKLDTAMQESHLVRHATNFLLPDNIQASVNTDKLGFYVGLGWMITTNFGHEIVWHNGGTADGYNVFIAFNPKTEKGIVILCNADLMNINISNIVFNTNDNLSSLILGLLNRK